LKKIFLLILIQSFILSDTIGQENKFIPISSFGIRQGANVSFVDFSPTVSTGILYGYNGGLVFRHVNEELFALQVELNFTQKGWIESLDTIPNTYNRKLSYIELPFLTQIFIGKRDVKYYLNLGPSVAYLISEKENMTIGNEQYVREYYNKAINNKFDFSVVGEIGIRYDSKIGMFNMGIRYYYTMTNLFKYNSENTYEISRNQTINIALTYFVF